METIQLGSAAALSPAGKYTIAEPTTFNSIIVTVGQTKVTIKADGTVEYGDGSTPDDAARAFWEVVGRYHPIPRIIAACAKVCDDADKSTHPAELADRIRALPTQAPT